MVVKHIKITFLAIFIVVVGLISTTKLNALEKTNDTEIAYFDYRGIYLSPNDYQDGESLTYAEYYDIAFGQYINTFILHSRFNVDAVNVVFIPINYYVVEGLSAFGEDKLEFIKVRYDIVVNSSDIITEINLSNSEIYIRTLIIDYKNVDIIDIPSSNFQLFFTNIIASMPNIETINQDIYNDGYNDGYDYAYELGYINGKYFGYNDGLEKVFYDGFVGTQYSNENSFPYNKGFNDGVATNSDFSFVGLLEQIFVGLGSLLAINLLPGISIGVIIAVPLVFGIIYFILGKRRGDD